MTSTDSGVRRLLLSEITRSDANSIVSGHEIQPRRGILPAPNARQETGQVLQALDYDVDNLAFSLNSATDAYHCAGQNLAPESLIGLGPYDQV